MRKVPLRHTVKPKFLTLMFFKLQFIFVFRRRGSKSHGKIIEKLVSLCQKLFLFSKIFAKRQSTFSFSTLLIINFFFCSRPSTQSLCEEMNSIHSKRRLQRQEKNKDDDLLILCHLLFFMFFVDLIQNRCVLFLYRVGPEFHYLLFDDAFSLLPSSFPCLLHLHDFY